MGINTALFTLNLDRIAWQPCNPAVGGPAKSQLLHEVDALGGGISKPADHTTEGIHLMHQLAFSGSAQLDYRAAKRSDLN